VLHINQTPLSSTPAPKAKADCTQTPHADCTQTPCALNNQSSQTHCIGPTWLGHEVSTTIKRCMVTILTIMSRHCLHTHFLGCLTAHTRWLERLEFRTLNMHSRWWSISGRALGHALQIRPTFAQHMHADKIGCDREP
jgi:hypothetical protein